MAVYKVSHRRDKGHHVMDSSPAPRWRRELSITAACIIWYVLGVLSTTGILWLFGAL